MPSRKLALAIAALIALATAPTASAHMFDIDENGNTTPSQNGPPDPPESSGGGGTYTQTTAANLDPGTTLVGGSGSCTYRVEGKLVVRNPTVAGIANNAPLPGVEV